MFGAVRRFVQLAWTAGTPFCNLAGDDCASSPLEHANGGTISVPDHFGARTEPWSWGSTNFTINTCNDEPHVKPGEKDPCAAPA